MLKAYSDLDRELCMFSVLIHKGSMEEMGSTWLRMVRFCAEEYSRWETWGILLKPF